MNRCYYFENGNRCLNIVSIDKKYCNICLKKPQYLDLIIKLCESDKIKLTYSNVRSILCNPHFDFLDLHKLQTLTSINLQKVLLSGILIGIFKIHYFTNSELLYFLQYLDYDISQKCEYINHDCDTSMNITTGFFTFNYTHLCIKNNLSVFQALQYLNSNSNYTLSDLKNMELLTNGYFKIKHLYLSENKNLKLSYVAQNLKSEYYISLLQNCRIDTNLEIFDSVKFYNNHPIFFNIFNIYINETCTLEIIKTNLNYLQKLFCRVPKHLDEFVPNLNLTPSQILENSNLWDIGYMLYNPNLRECDLQKFKFKICPNFRFSIPKYNFLHPDIVKSQIYDIYFNTTRKTIYAANFSAYKGLNLKYVKNKNLDWDYNILSENPSFSIIDIYNNLDLPWNFDLLLENKFQYTIIPKYKINDRIEFEFEKMYELSEILKSQIPEDLIIILVQYM